MAPDISIRKTLICVAIAALLLAVPEGRAFTAEIRFTGAVGLLMALLWLTEAVPMGLTALIPLVAFPMAGVVSSEKIAAPYANPAVFLFLGGFLLSATFERCGLHRRLAWFALHHVGTEPRRIVFAVIAVTAFLSMWISNTATTLMMAPIAVAIVTGLGAQRMDRESARDSDATLSSRASDKSLRIRSATAEATLLGVAYAASLGGIATPIGTPTNLIFLGAARQLFPGEPEISFAQWMLFGIPYLLILVPVCWMLVIVTARVPRGAAIPLESLGIARPERMKRAELTTVVLCALTAFLWMFRADIRIGATTIPGWASLLPVPKMVGDATVAVFMALIAFLLPGEKKGERLLPWQELQRVPWDVLILFGGGFALAEALETSGFSKWAGDKLTFFGTWPSVLMIVAVCIFVTLLSEVASNVATATAAMPIMAALAASVGVHPYFLMIPAVLAASSGFMLPVATAPNTIVYSTGFVRVRSMARSGALLDIAAAIVITLLIFTIIPWATGVVMR